MTAPALVIAWRTRHLKLELAHNLAIVFWISANSYWMLSELFGFESVPTGHLTDGKRLAITHLQPWPGHPGLVLPPY